MHTQCHICNENVNPKDIRDVEFCDICSNLYYIFKKNFGTWHAKDAFKELQARRQVAVNRTRFKLIQGGK